MCGPKIFFILFFNDKGSVKCFVDLPSDIYGISKQDFSRSAVFNLEKFVLTGEFDNVLSHFHLSKLLGMERGVIMLLVSTR